MIYTIATMQGHCTDRPLTLEIEAQGNKYSVSLYSKEGSTTRRVFDELTDAYKVFEKLSSWIVFGYYSEEDKRKYLETGTMD